MHAVSGFREGPLLSSFTRRDLHPGVDGPGALQGLLSTHGADCPSLMTGASRNETEQVHLARAHDEVTLPFEKILPQLGRFFCRAFMVGFPSG